MSESVCLSIAVSLSVCLAFQGFSVFDRRYQMPSEQERSKVIKRPKARIGQTFSAAVPNYLLSTTLLAFVVYRPSHQPNMSLLYEPPLYTVSQKGTPTLLVVTLRRINGF